jgi:hypothetical protein
MKFQWTSDLGPLEGRAIFLSASVPDPKRNPRFLKGPIGEAHMLRVIGARIDPAVKSLSAHVLQSGGRIVHGGHPKIFAPLADQASNWHAEGAPPFIIYQSKYFAAEPPPPGRVEMERSNTAAIVWTPRNLGEVAQKFEIPEADIKRWLPLQAPEKAPHELKEALLAMRIQMLLETHPVAAVCIGGMEGIEAEARLYWDLVQQKRLPSSNGVFILESTFGAAKQLAPEPEVISIEKEFAPEFSRRISEQTARAELERPVLYDPIMSGFVRRLRKNEIQSEQVKKSVRFEKRNDEMQ